MIDHELTRLLAVGIATENGHTIASLRNGRVTPGPNTLSMARQRIADAMGKADWLWDEQIQTHIPCCTHQTEDVFRRPRRCGNGPLVGDQIVSGDCGEHTT